MEKKLKQFFFQNSNCGGKKLKISVYASFEIISTLRQFIRILSMSILKKWPGFEDRHS